MDILKKLELMIECNLTETSSLDILAREIINKLYADFGDDINIKDPDIIAVVRRYAKDNNIKTHNLLYAIGKNI